MFVAFRPGVQPAPKNKPILCPFLLNSSSAYNSPPRGVAAARATFQVASIQPNSRPNSQPKSVGFVLGAPPRAAKASPLPRTAIPEESRYSLSD